MSSFSPFSKEELLPQEEKLEIKNLKVGYLLDYPKKHITRKRVCLTPDAVAALTANGHSIVIETGAGDGSNYSDSEYSEAEPKLPTIQKRPLV